MIQSQLDSPLKRTPSAEIVSAVRDAMESPHGRLVAMQLGLVAIGEKPASLRCFVLRACDERLFGFEGSWWDGKVLLGVLRADGVAVVEGENVLRSTSSSQVKSVNVAVSLSERRAHHLLRAIRAIQDAAQTEDRRRSRNLELRTGALLGYPRSGTLAWLDRLPTLSKPSVDLESLLGGDLPFSDCIIAAEEPGRSEGVARVKRLAAAFRQAFGVG